MASPTGPPPIPLDIPKSSENALSFLRAIEENDFDRLLFGDALVTTSDTGKEVGEFSVDIEPAEYRGEPCFLIHANSHGKVDNVPCGTSITTYISHRLETLEQQHHEYVKLQDLPLDRKTSIVKQNDGYSINKVILQGKEEHRMTRHFNIDLMDGFISEGSNLLLQRLMIKKGLPEDFRLVSFDADTNLCAATYSSLDERIQKVGEEEFSVRGLERTIESTTGLPTTWQSYFTKDCHLSNRVQVGSPVTMKLVTVPKPIDQDEEPPKPEFEKQPLGWEEDMQMYSKYLDRKEELKSDHCLYMRRHPELRALVADFLQFLLLRKPDDVVSFARDYFSAFSAHIADRPAYASSVDTA